MSALDNRTDIYGGNQQTKCSPKNKGWSDCVHPCDG